MNSRVSGQCVYTIFDNRPMWDIANQDISVILSLTLIWVCQGLLLFCVKRKQILSNYRKGYYMYINVHVKIEKI